MNTPTLFGTDGIRQAFGNAPLTVLDLQQLGHAFATWAHKQYGDSPTIIIAHDTRASCALIKAALKTSLLQYGIAIYDAGTLPTPALYHLVTHTKKFNCGIMITASHNPHTDNGIKLIDAHTGKLSEKDEQAITTLFYQTKKPDNPICFGSDIPYPTAAKEYTTKVQAMFPVNFLQDKKVVLDCAHGATHAIAPQLFALFGANTIVINNTPNGTNINDACGAVHPEQLQQAVVQHGADAGCAFDGDGDRVIAVNHKGKIKDGDEILALLHTHPTYKNQSTVVSTIMANEGLAVWLAKRNIKLLRTAVGDKHVAQALQKHNFLLGGEQSGHIIMSDYANTGDGIVTALRILQTMLLTDNKNMYTFDRYPQILINVPVGVKKNLNDKMIHAVIAAYKQQLSAGRLVVRYSGTQPLLRVMVEDKKYEHAHAIGTQLAQKLKQMLN